VTHKLTPQQQLELGLEPGAYQAATAAWGGDRRTPDWKQKLAKKRGTKKTRQLAFAMQAPHAPKERK
jgi:hypothetical protein